MRHMLISGLATLSLTLLSHPATAQRERGFYLLGALGNSNADVNLGVTDDGYLKHVGRRDNGFTLGGGYEFNDHLSLEAAYQDLGRQTGSFGCPGARQRAYVSANRRPTSDRC